MGARDLIGRLALAGVRLSILAPDKLAAEPRAALTDDLRRLIRAHKPALLAALATPAEAEKLAARGRRELGWRDADVRDFLDVSFAQHPHAALVALAELLDFVQREPQRAAGGLTRGA